MTTPANLTLTPTPASTPDTPEETAQAWFDAITAKDEDKLASLHVPEHRELVRECWGRMFRARLYFSDLEVDMISQTEEKVELTAKYDAGTLSKDHIE